MGTGREVKRESAKSSISLSNRGNIIASQREQGSRESQEGSGGGGVLSY